MAGTNTTTPSVAGTNITTPSVTETNTTTPSVTATNVGVIFDDTFFTPPSVTAPNTTPPTVTEMNTTTPSVAAMNVGAIFDDTFFTPPSVTAPNTTPPSVASTNVGAIFNNDNALLTPSVMETNIMTTTRKRNTESFIEKHHVAAGSEPNLNIESVLEDVFRSTPQSVTPEHDLRLQFRTDAVFNENIFPSAAENTEPKKTEADQPSVDNMNNTCTVSNFFTSFFTESDEELLATYNKVNELLSKFSMEKKRRIETYTFEKRKRTEFKMSIKF